MRVIHWEPFRDIDDVFDRFFADTLRRQARAGRPGAAGIDWAPVADVTESEDEYLIKAEIPEVRKEDLSVTVQDGVLTLSGERKQEKRAEGEKAHRVERHYGTFARRFALPENADEQSIPRREPRRRGPDPHPEAEGRAAPAAADHDPVSSRLTECRGGADRARPSSLAGRRAAVRFSIIALRPGNSPAARGDP